MKHVLLVLVLSISTIFAATITCNSDDGDGVDQSVIITDSLQMTDCYDNTTGFRYGIKFEGIGVGLRTAACTSVVIACPLKEDATGTYLGVKASAIFGIGLNVSLFIGKGLCTVDGIEFGIGVGASLGSLKIVKH